MKAPTSTDLVIQTLAESEATQRDRIGRQQAQIIALTSTVSGYRTVAQVALARVAELERNRQRLRERIAKLVREVRQLRRRPRREAA